MQHYLDEIMILFKGVFIKDLKYSINDDFFYYGVLTKGGDDLIYKYTKEEHEKIQHYKKLEWWRG